MNQVTLPSIVKFKNASVMIGEISLIQIWCGFDIFVNSCATWLLKMRKKTWRAAFFSVFIDKSKLTWKIVQLKTPSVLASNVSLILQHSNRYGTSSSTQSNYYYYSLLKDITSEREYLEAISANGGTCSTSILTIMRYQYLWAIILSRRDLMVPNFKPFDPHFVNIVSYCFHTVHSFWNMTTFLLIG